MKANMPVVEMLRNIAQIILRWLTQQDIVAIPKSARPERIAENFAIFDLRISWSNWR